MIRHAEQLEWRDALLDRVALRLARSRQTKPMARWMTHFLKDARQNEADDALEPAAAAGGHYTLTEWTRERLPELDHPRADSSLRALRLRLETLTAEFRIIREDDALEGRTRRPADWRPIIEHHERALIDRGGHCAPLARHPLTRSQRDKVIATERRTIRTPRSMALHLLHLACRPTDDLAEFRRTLDRVKIDKPPAL